MGTALSLQPDQPTPPGSVFVGTISRIDPVQVTVDGYGPDFEWPPATWMGVGTLPVRGARALLVIDDEGGCWVFPGGGAPSIDLDMLAAAVVERMWATGDVRHTLRSTAADGWVFPAGQALTATSALRTMLLAQGSPWGSSGGDPKLPDLGGRALVGAGTGSGLTARTLGDLVGTETHALTTAQMPSHTHPPAAPATAFWVSDPAGPYAPATPAGATMNVTALTGSTGGGASHPNMQPSAAVNIEVKL